MFSKSALSPMNKGIINLVKLKTKRKVCIDM